MNFEYELYPGSHSQSMKAIKQAEKLRLDFGYESHLLVESDENIHICVACIAGYPTGIRY